MPAFVQELPPSEFVEAIALAWGVAREDYALGMHRKKITKGLYADIGGHYKEVCQDEFFEAMGTPADIGKKNCGNSKALLAGCLWDETKGECVYGLKKMIRCYTQYKDDDKL